MGKPSKMALVIRDFEQQMNDIDKEIQLLMDNRKQVEAMVGTLKKYNQKKGEDEKKD